MAALRHPLTFVVAASLTSSLLAAMLWRAAGLEILLGMLGPLVAVSATWVLIERTFVRNPAGVTGVMIQGFIFKLLFFGIYLVGMLGGLELRPMPFAVSFMGHFVALYVAEGWLIKRLTSQGVAG